MPDNPTTDPVETDPTTDPADPAGVTDPADDGTEDARVTRANRQAAQYRTQLRTQEQATADLQAKLDEQAATLSKLAAVFNPDAPQGADPAEALQTITAEAETLRTELAQARAELAVHNLAADNGGNPNALLDSRSFLSTLQALDASADDYQDQVAEAIKSAVASNATLSATGPGPAKGGAPGAGQGSAASGGVTQEQFDAMGLAQRNELFRTDPDTYERLAASIR